MKTASMPTTPNEKAIEIKLLLDVMMAIKYGASLQEVLNALERVRFTTTELALEVQENGA